MTSALVAYGQMAERFRRSVEDSLPGGFRVALGDAELHSGTFQLVVSGGGQKGEFWVDLQIVEAHPENIRRATVGQILQTFDVRREQP